jgi:protein involved in polysaccharide export with SLBB domain
MRFSRLNSPATRPLHTLLAVVALVLAGSSGLAAQDADTVAVSPGDAVRVEVWRNPELSGTFTVDAKGVLSHPLYRQIHASGLAEAGLRDRIGQFLKQFESDPQYVVTPLLRITVGGEVRQPNVVMMPRETNVVQAIAMAGGPTDRADLRKTWVIRSGQKLSVDLLGPQTGVAWQRVHSGDQIIVGRHVDYLREYIAPVASILAAVGTFIYRVR